MKKILLISFSLLFLLIWNSCEKNQRFSETSNLDYKNLETLDYFDINRFEESIKLKRVETDGQVIVANRGSGSISVINTISDEVEQTVDLPAGDNSPEPMYVLSKPFTQKVFVGDRGNDRIVVFNQDFSVEGTVEVGKGVFHMWSDLYGKQLWVVNDIDKTISVINTHTLATMATIPIPDDLVAKNGKPHDVIVSPKGYLAYVTILGVDGDSDFVVQYSTESFEEINRIAVGKDPHLSIKYGSEFLYVPCQNSNAVYVLNRFSLELIDIIDTPGAHGAGMPVFGHIFYATNLPNGGTGGLVAIDMKTNTVIGTTDTPFPVPHNIATNINGRKLYITHSGGSSNKVTVYEIIRGSNVPVFVKEIIVGTNPFGLTPMF